MPVGWPREALALGCTQGRVGTLWPMGSSGDHIYNVRCLCSQQVNKCIKLWLAAGSWVFNLGPRPLLGVLHNRPDETSRMGWEQS